MPEELAFKDVFRNRATVYGNELSCPSAKMMKRLRNQLFASSAFTENKDCRACSGDLLNHPEYFLHLGTAAQYVEETLRSLRSRLSGKREIAQGLCGR